MTFPLSLCFTQSLPPADLREDEGSDDNRSSSLGRSAPSDDASVVSDYQEDGVADCKLTAVLMAGSSFVWAIVGALQRFVRDVCVCLCTARTKQQQQQKTVHFSLWATYSPSSSKLDLTSKVTE